MAETVVVVTLRANHLGIIRVPLSVVSVGSKRPPTEVALEAAARGPLVRFFQNLDAAMDELSAKAANAETLRDPLTGDVSAATLVSTSDCGTERPNGFRVRFGKVGVLCDAYRSVFARNDGPVPAELRAFTRDGEPAFEVDAASRDATLQPGRFAKSSFARTWIRRSRIATRCASWSRKGARPCSRWRLRAWGRW